MLIRLFDFLFALILIIITLPLMLIIAFLIWTSMGSPVFFKQLRPGLKGEPFFLYKFRTMHILKYEYGRPLPDDRRLTRLGRVLRKFSLDELPQLLNVVKSDLSFVGPRPLLMQYMERYSPEQARRHEVKPGITGWAQVNGRNAISWEEKFDYDIWYVDNKGLFLNLKILWLTLIKVLKTEGISGAESATMTEFMGSKRKVEGFTDSSPGNGQ